MADFNKVIGFVLGKEGGYVNDPDDAGGETYCGISRKHNPHWEGWLLIDRYKPLKYNQVLRDTLIAEMVSTYYYKMYWCAVAGDKIDCLAVAAMAFDWQVNSGDVATKALQQLVGVKPDGDIGPVTVAAINNYPANRLFGHLRERRIQFYRNLVKSKPVNAKYLKGWLARVDGLTKEFS